MRDSEQQYHSTQRGPPITLSEALEYLRQAIASFERYEDAIEDERYTKTIETVHWLRAFSDRVLEEPETLDQLVSYFASRLFPQADDAYVRLAAYQRYRKSRKFSEVLRDALPLTQHLRKLAVTVQERIASAETVFLIGEKCTAF